MQPGHLNLSYLVFACVLQLACVARSEAGTATIAYDATGSSKQSGVVLVGTLLLRKGNDRGDLALISIDGTAARWFAVDHAITPEITLVENQLRRVFLREMGKVVELKFVTQDGATAKLQNQEPPPMPALPAHAHTLSAPIPGILNFTDTHFKISRKVIADYMHSFEALRDNRAMLLKEGGLFITGMRDDSILEKAGLRVGDVLTAVDGKPLKDLKDLQSLFDHLTPSDESRRIDIELTRFGSTQHLTYDLSN